MYVAENTIDDLMRRVLTKLAKRPFNVEASRGKSSEVVGALLCLKNPRARLSRTETRGRPFSALGEFLWYLSKTHSLDFISYYIPQYKDESSDGKTIYGGYGPRLFKMRGKHNQVDNVIKLLKKKNTSRRAVIQLFNAEDISQSRKEPKDIPCTCTLQFIVRSNRLHMFTSMRSNDAYKGLPHDVFAFTMLQEIIANSLEVDLGEYIHAVGSLHLYEDKLDETKTFLSEGWQATNKPMPPMPTGDQNAAIRAVLKAESILRKGKALKVESLKLDPYWSDLVRLLQIFSLLKGKRFSSAAQKKVKKIRNEMNSPAYHPYIDKRLSTKLAAQKKKPKRKQE